MKKRNTPCTNDEAGHLRPGQRLLRVFRSLPRDPTLVSVSRLGLTALLFAGAFLVGMTLTFVLAAMGEPPPHVLGTVVFVASTTLSLLVFLLVHYWKFGLRSLIYVGACYEVLIALALSLREGSQTGAYGGPIWGVSWVCVLIVLFPFLVPTSARRTLVVALTAASMGPLAYAILLGLGEVDLTPVSRLLRLYLPNYIAAALAVVPAMIIHRLGRDVKRAHEMGSYRIVERLGQGGMGEVWRAEHRMLARPAAIKLVRPEYLGGQCSESCVNTFRRFEREAQATALLRSPHTIQLYDFGVTSDNIFYYVMELLEGFDLDTEINRFGPLRPERTIHFLRQVCHSLGEAHEIGLIHRDVKPANVYVCRYGREVDFIKVLDFGLVTWARREDEHDLTETSEHISPGTPAFMAPEQILGDRPIDARTDIYAVGCLAYWLLTANLVFEADTSLAVMLHHVNTTPVPPSKRTEQEIPEALEAVVLSCLEKDPALRPQTADELSEMLTRASREPWTSARAHQWWEINNPRPKVPSFSRG